MNLEDFQYSRANITGFRIVNTETKDYEKLLKETNYRLLKRREEPVPSLTVSMYLTYFVKNGSFKTFLIIT